MRLSVCCSKNQEKNIPAQGSRIGKFIFHNGRVCCAVSKEMKWFFCVRWYDSLWRCMLHISYIIRVEIHISVGWATQIPPFLCVVDELMCAWNILRIDQICCEFFMCVNSTEFRSCYIVTRCDTHPIQRRANIIDDNLGLPFALAGMLPHIVELAI